MAKNELLMQYECFILDFHTLDDILIVLFPQQFSDNDKFQMIYCMI